MDNILFTLSNIILTQSESFFNFSRNIMPVDAVSLPERLGNNIIVSVIIVLSFILITLTYRSSSSYFVSVFNDIFQMKERGSYMPRTNVGIVRIRLLMMINTFVLDSFAIYLAYHYFTESVLTGVNLLIWLLIFGTASFMFFIIRFLIYKLLGYIFNDSVKVSLLLNSLISLTSIRGILILLPVLIAIYYTYSLIFFIKIFIFIYFVIRLIFIYNGVKIFFNGFYSLIYLILYLCTLEIAPLLFIYKGIFQLFSFVELKLF